MSEMFCYCNSIKKKDIFSMVREYNLTPSDAAKMLGCGNRCGDCLKNRLKEIDTETVNT